MIFKKLARFIWCLFFPPIIYKEKNNLGFRGVCDIRVGTEKVFSSS